MVGRGRGLRSPSDLLVEPGKVVPGCCPLQLLHLFRMLWKNFNWE